MPKITHEFEEGIKKIPLPELQKIVLNLAKKNREIYDYLDVRYISKREGDDELYEHTIWCIELEMRDLTGRVIQKNIARAMGKAVADINHYAKASKNKVGEAKLLLHLLKIVYENYSDELGTCWTIFDSKLAITTNRLIHLVTKKLHPDYFIEFEESLNTFLKILHEKSGIDYVYRMPKNIQRADI